MISTGFDYNGKFNKIFKDFEDFKDIKTTLQKVDVFSMGIVLIHLLRHWFHYTPIVNEDNSLVLNYQDKDRKKYKKMAKY